MTCFPMSMNETVIDKLPRSFYLRPTVQVAQDLLRKTIVFRHPEGILSADIVETEAYIGQDDPACHAAVGKTARNAVMFGPGGFGYIYFIYGMYHCFNVVTEKEGFPAAVLIRAVEPISGIDIIIRNSPPSDKLYTNGPGKFCRAFGLTRAHNSLDLTGDSLYILDRGAQPRSISISERIGIKKGREKKWRFFDGDSPYISQK